MDERQEKGKQAAIEGFAHEHIAVGILMKRFQNVSLVDLPLSSYDIIIALKKKDGSEEIIRAQVKTAKKQINFVGGRRGGIDRTYKSNVKEYVQSTKTSDVVIGVHPNKGGGLDLYFVPTILIERLRQKYGMDFDEFFDATEDLRKFEQLMKRGFDPDEILQDVTEWEILLDELHELKKKIKPLK